MLSPGEGSMLSPGSGGAEAAPEGGSGTAPVARPPPTLPPFLSKCYDMVDDPSTDSAVSWGPDGGSFVIWDPHAFSKHLLPKYFKHSNLSSFVRQLNTYGFHKVDPDRWEFANEGFLKGQKQLLKSIMRKKNSQAVSQSRPVAQGKHSSVKACVEVGKFGLEEEVERLKRDKNVLMQELVKLRQHQQNTDDELRTVRERLQVMEQHQQQMVSFLAMAVQSPGFFDKLIQQNVKTRWRTEVNKKRRLPALEQGSNSMSTPSEGQIVKYQPLPPENWTSSSLTLISDIEVTPGKDPLSDGISGLNISANDNVSAMQSYTPTEEESFFDIPDDYLEQLLGSPLLENGENINQGDLNFSDCGMDFDFLELETQIATP